MHAREPQWRHPTPYCIPTCTHSIQRVVTSWLLLGAQSLCSIAFLPTVEVPIYYSIHHTACTYQSWLCGLSSTNWYASCSPTFSRRSCVSLRDYSRCERLLDKKSLAALPYLAYEQLTKQTADTGNTLLTYLCLKINNTVLSWIVRVLGNKQIFNKVVLLQIHVCMQ